MCWNEKASLGLAIAGTIVTVWSYLHGVPLYHVALLAFFTGMEILQYVQYKYIDKCNDPRNIALTKVAWLYIWSQPLLFNVTEFWKNRGVYTPQMVVWTIVSLVVFLLAIDMIITKKVFRLEDDPDTMVQTQRINHHIPNLKPANCTRTGMSHLWWQFSTGRTGIEVVDNIHRASVYMVLLFAPLVWFAIMRKNTINVVALMGAALSFAVSIFYVMIIKKAPLYEVPSFWCLMAIPYLLITTTYYW